MSIWKYWKLFFSPTLIIITDIPILYWPFGPTVRAIWDLEYHNCASYNQNCVGANTHPILACVLSAHGCGWNFWSEWSSASIFRSQPSFYMYKKATYPLLVCDQNKMDTKPISTVPDIMLNLALISGTVKISAASILLWLNTSWCYGALLVNIISDRPCNFGGKLSTKHFL